MNLEVQLAYGALNTDVLNKILEIVQKEHPDITIRAFKQSMKEHPELWEIIVKAAKRIIEED